MASRARRRVGVALMLDSPVADEVQGLRRALGDGAIDRIAPHLTLVAPLNLRDDDLPAALRRLRLAAAGAPPTLELMLGPVATFAPANPVLYLAVTEPPPALGALRAAVYQSPLQRPASWPWVPHVTVADDVEPARIPAATAALDAYRRRVDFDRIVLLELRDGKWEPLADAAFGPPARVGAGGLALELTRATTVDPEAAALLDRPPPARVSPGREAPAVSSGREAPAVPLRKPIVFTARREGVVCGVGGAWISDGGGRIAVFVASPERRRGVGRQLVLALESAVTAAGWDCEQLGAIGPPGFYSAVSDRSRSYSKATDA